MLIRGTCFTNLDGYAATSWPKQFVAVPRKGEMVEAIRGDKRLQVVEVTHIQDVNGNPYIRVELHNRLLG